MKNVARFLTLFCMVTFFHPNLYSSQALDACDYETNEQEESCEPLGYGSDKAAYTTVSMSMIGWGLGLAAAIAILTGIISQSTSGSTSSGSG
ncbi:MAG: hypothetical protein AAF443_04305 [Chlamydiota bacterium]